MWVALPGSETLALVSGVALVKYEISPLASSAVPVGYETPTTAPAGSETMVLTSIMAIADS